MAMGSSCFYLTASDSTALTGRCELSRAPSHGTLVCTHSSRQEQPGSLAWRLRGAHRATHGRAKQSRGEPDARMSFDLARTSHQAEDSTWQRW